jgi:anti-sigma factor RsiW
MMDHVTCTAVLDMVEAIAAGDIEPAPAVRAHVESCPRCAAALASARRLETLLSRREAPAAPPRFAAAVLARVRRERWRAEQRVDRLFNLAIVVAVLLVIVGLGAILNVDVVLSWAGSTWTYVTELARRDATRQGPSTLLTYLAAVGFMVSAVAMWWWAERRMSL